ncbi:MAG: hypothetical protein DID92_2727745319 [Candidatus Nitrotoga sp. SPKER]|nr:MAG: hypothetical protein DID92_2727745319 [Candidatus Nitrotoga sp. SPKER]
MLDALIDFSKLSFFLFTVLIILLHRLIRHFCEILIYLIDFKLVPVFAGTTIVY